LVLLLLLAVVVVVLLPAGISLRVLPGTAAGTHI